MSTANQRLFWKTWSFLKATDRSGIVSLTDLRTTLHYWICFPLHLSTVCQILRDTFFSLFFSLPYFHSQLTNSILVPCYSWKFLFLKRHYLSVFMQFSYMLSIKRSKCDRREKLSTERQKKQFSRLIKWTTWEKNLVRKFTFQVKLTVLQLTQDEEKKESTGLCNWKVQTLGWLETQIDLGAQKWPWGCRSAGLHSAVRLFSCGSKMPTVAAKFWASRLASLVEREFLSLTSIQ